ncbi:MAG: hypothetical protein KGI37_07625 [Alphaproteobacteria bacterium]|nr:hypothetical protein [Alphaproteobacteria bacterium]
MGNRIPSASQIRSAQAMLNWSNMELADAAQLSVDVIVDARGGRVATQQRIRDRLRRVFESAGVEFLENDGIRKQPSDLEIFVGVDRFQDFTDFMYDYLKKHGGEVCVSIGDERQMQRARKDAKQHRARMMELTAGGTVTGRILAAEGDFRQTWAQLRRQEKTADMPQVSFYAFGDCLALISFDHDPSPYVVLHKSGPFAAAYRQAFNAAWEKAQPV